ncbi:RNA-binding protein cabeza-like [Phalaenopsis equestris]|uniref:RNA-binding protein cabeza-like n=1 Tax=Phalaenopsis equestris TaxID=78828 RepID=UPI0009E4A749|nr:RNA-binding protein cabeza-like [Phalaenopsis equestris]
MNRKPGDWNCRSCHSRRDSCQRCGDPRSGGGDRTDYGSFGGGRGGSSFVFSTGSDVRPGDWYCQCGAHNFASRSSCFKCGGFKEDTSVGIGNLDGGDAPRPRGYGFGGGGGGGSGRSGWKSGDWICTRSGCNEHNFASRMECFRCNAPRDSGTEV